MLKIKKNNPVLLSLVVIVLLIFLHFSGFSKPLESFLTNSVQGINSRIYKWSLGFNKSSSRGSSPQDLEKKIASLEKKVAFLTVANSQYLETKIENKKLRSLLKLSASHNFKTLSAQVIAKRLAASNNSDLVINRGSQDGLVPGLGVINEEGAIIGKIVSVKENIAALRLTTSLDCKLAAMIQNQERTQGITTGDLGLTIKMNYIPQGDKVFPGDIIVSSGLGGQIPQGLLIGKVIKVYDTSNKIWQEATIEPLVNFNDLTIVSVIIP